MLWGRALEQEGPEAAGVALLPLEHFWKKWVEIHSQSQVMTRHEGNKAFC